MKRLILILALLGATLGVAGAGAPAASAGANCTAGVVPNGLIWYSGGYWYITAKLYNCSGINGVQFFGHDSGSWSGITDVSHGQDHFTADNGVTYLVGGSEFTWTYGTPVWGMGCGYPAFVAHIFYTWRIRNAVGSTWGSKIRSTGFNQALC